MFRAARRDASAQAAQLGTALVALRLQAGTRLPPGCVELVFSAAGVARRAPPGRAAKGEAAYAYHPGPYDTAFAPFAAAPEIGLRLRYVVDAADPREAQQRFDLFLFSEAGDALSVAALDDAIAAAVRAALAQGTLDLPACTTLDEWHGFRAGLNELLYTRFGLTVDDCIPVDLGDACDYAALLRARMGGPPGDAAVRGGAGPADGATTASGATSAVGVPAPSGVAQPAASLQPAPRARSTAGALAAFLTGARQMPERAPGPAPVSATEPTPGPAETSATDPGLRPDPAFTMEPALHPAPASLKHAAVHPEPTRRTAPASAAVSSPAYSPGLASGPQPAPLRQPAASVRPPSPSRLAPSPVSRGASQPASPLPGAPALLAGAGPWAGAANHRGAGHAGHPGVGGSGIAGADAHALRRLFLELPAWSAAVRALALPAGQALFAARREVLQRCALAALEANTMPSLALAAPGRPLAPALQARRAVHSAAAALALDEAWALLARWRVAALDGAAPDHVHAALLDEADRLVCNLAFHLSGRRAMEPADDASAGRKEPSL